MADRRFNRVVKTSRLLWLDLAVKAALVALLLFGAFSGLDRFEGKAFGGRAIAYPIATLMVPFGWWIVARRSGRRPDYPYLLDILLVLPFLIDTVGNALDLYDTIGWWDDANHFVNWGILTLAFGVLLLRLPVGRWNTFALAVGFGAVTAVLWEFAEYITFIRNSDELETAYTDTLGDLALGLSGAVVAAIVTAVRRTARVSGRSS
jgi:hypothetical protein